MRLDRIQKTALEKALKKVKGEVYLFGSRIDYKKKDGDIDILIFSDKNPYGFQRK
jgi:predicted nucleotidyltransferase